MTREEAIRHIRDVIAENNSIKPNIVTFEQEKEALYMAIEALADRPTGKWEIKTETDEYGLKRPKLVCSKCEKEPAAWDLTELFEFCPNCGAEMVREERKDD